MNRETTLRVRVVGGSMWPAFRDGEEITVRTLVDPAAIRPGDVALVYLGSHALLHRVCRVRAGGVIARGDALVHEDAPVPLERVVGVAVNPRRLRGVLARAIARLRALRRRLS